MQSFNSEANIMLEKHPLFVIFNKSVINDITSKCTIANVEANEMIIQEGKITNEEFYLLIEGKANVYIYDQQKKIFLLNT